MSSRILVVGATGFVGCGAVAELEARGADFAAATRDPARARSLLGDGPTVVPIAPEDPDAMVRAVEGFTALLLIPPETGGEGKLAIASAFAQAAARVGVERVATVTGLSAIRDEGSISRRVERAVETLGFAFTHLRPNFFMQNYEGAQRAAIQRGEIDTFTGAGRTSLVDARDVGAAAAVTLLEPGQEDDGPILTGPEALDAAAIAEILSRVLGRSIRYTAGSHDDTRAALRAVGLSEAAIEAAVARYREVEAGAFAEITPALGGILGRAPRSFERYARDRAAVWRAG